MLDRERDIVIHAREQNTAIHNVNDTVASDVRVRALQESLTDAHAHADSVATDMLGSAMVAEVPLTATPCNILQHAATHCNALQHTATHCNTL